jgi:nickel/cobalt transporter (NicO) family protein
MYQIFIGSFVLSLIHSLIPNHWIPLIAISKTERWTLRQTLLATAITGFSHTFSTILIGIAVGIVGYKLSAAYSIVTTIAAPFILLSLGLIYVLLDFIGNHHHHEHEHAPAALNKTGKSRWRAILASLSVAMFLTPCIEIEAYYFQAGTIGWLGILIVSAVYLLMTLIVMLLLVYFGVKGMQTLNSHFLEHHEKGITGIVLIALGLLAYFVQF